MSKTSNYETALRLSQITGRALEEFYDGCNRAENNSNDESVQDLPEIEHGQDTSSEETISTNCETSLVELKILANKYEGDIVKGRVMNGREMTRKEYLEEKKKFNTKADFDNSPLLYKMFRAEGQTEANFLVWSNKIEKELK